jgi:hypothetical protein
VNVGWPYISIIIKIVPQEAFLVGRERNGIRTKLKIGFFRRKYLTIITSTLQMREVKAVKSDRVPPFNKKTHKFPD